MAGLAAELARFQRESERPLTICLVGPTASGKTDLAVGLVETLPCDIISVDSAQVYRGMDIGSAKPDAATLARAPHRLIDLLDPAESYSAASFRRDALAEMQAIIDAGRVPLLVGGTMLYFRALLYGLAALPAANAQVRERLAREAEISGWPALHRRLAEVDPATAWRLKPTDSQRIQRALEVYEVSGKPISRLHSEQGQAGKWELAADFPARPLLWGISPEDRAVLHRRIAARFDQMLQQGLVAEVEALYQRDDLHAGLPALRSVGYRQVWEFLAGKLDKVQMRERGIIATRQLAKRQLTWMRGWAGLEWLQTDESGQEITSPDRFRGLDLASAARNLLRSALK